ncbi:MAG TPA: glycerol-3-phosphate dehydrogenase/oxidase [Verrucomicrobiae bacterium]
MNRAESLHAIQDRSIRWDVVVIGGGASGLGAAVDAASRGYRTLLIEQHDFAKGTSSRSTKLVHGGVRYLRQGNISLVRESLHERALLLRNAPHLTRKQSFIVPAYGRWDRAFYGIGLKLYDALAGRFSLGPSKLISRADALNEIPTIQSIGLRGGVRYFDGQFDDARLAICLAQTLHRLGGTPANYMRAMRFMKQNGRIAGVIAQDAESGHELEIAARVIINAAGVFTDDVRRLDDVSSSRLVTASQGAHIVVDRSFLPGETALMVPKTEDGRVLFAIPWHGRVVIGTTDTPVTETPLEPRPFAQEIEFLLEHAARYLAKAPASVDILSTFAGLRPLVKAGGGRNTSRLSRDHTIVISDSGLITVAGGKWTTYRKMGEDVINAAVSVGGMELHPSRTHDLQLDEAENTAQPGLTDEMIVSAVQREMARSVEDVLARRTRLLFLDARGAIATAPRVAAVMARELQRDAAWQAAQVESFTLLARGYVWNSSSTPQGIAAA